MSDNIEGIKRAKNEISRANNAEQVLRNPAFIEAIQMIKADCLGAFQHANQSDTKKHSEIWLQLNAINELEKNLESIMSDGIYARENLTMLQRTKKIIGL